MKKIILDLCGGTGSWSKPYAKADYDVINITLPKYNILENVFNVGGEMGFKNFKTYGIDWIKIKEVYGILAAPPCTMFSLARTRAKTPRDLKQGMEIVIACLNIIWKCRYENKLAFWALENPMGYLRQFLGNPVLTFDPCDYGDPYTKKTDLWGYFNIPKKNPISLDQETLERCKINNRKLPSISDFTGSKQSAKRAVTPQGFAKAFYEANK